MNFGDSYGNLVGKTRAEVVEQLWKGLNAAEPGRRGKVALDVADYLSVDCPFTSLRREFSPRECLL